MIQRGCYYINGFTENIRHVAIYLRLSRDEENKGINEILANHRKTLTELCDRNKWSYDLYQEIASGADRKRQQLDEMLVKVERNEYDAIVVNAVDRLGRDKTYCRYTRKVVCE